MSALTKNPKSSANIDISVQEDFNAYAGDKKKDDAEDSNRNKVNLTQDAELYADVSAVGHDCAAATGDDMYAEAGTAELMYEEPPQIDSSGGIVVNANKPNTMGGGRPRAATDRSNGNIEDVEYADLPAKPEVELPDETYVMPGHLSSEVDNYQVTYTQPNKHRDNPDEDHSSDLIYDAPE